MLLLFVVSHIQRIGCQPEKTTLHGGQSRSWSAEQGKENKRKSLAAYPPPPTPHTARSEKINKITRRIYRRYAGGRSRVRTRIPSARRLGLWVWLRKILHSVTPAGTSIDVQNEWEENTHTHIHTVIIVHRPLYRLFSFFFFPCPADHERDWQPCKV